jgi:aspartate kinase
MNVVVHKYGGSSLSTPEKIKAIARKVIAQKEAGCEVAVVVSAMGDTTDRFLGLAQAVSQQPSSRELDLLLTAGEQISASLLGMAISAEGHRAVSLTGPQAGIITCGAFNRARIVEVQPARVLVELGKGKIVVVAGFQGVSREGEVTTLGRGGSDTSAVALAAALRARRCDIYSDVDGVYSADPRVVPEAQRIEQIGYPEMLELARHGARVLNAEAVEHARVAGLEIRARSTFQDGSGTVIKDGVLQAPPVIGVAGRRQVVRITVRDPRVMPRLGPFLIRSKVLHSHRGDIFLGAESYSSSSALVDHVCQELGSGVACTDDLGAVSIVGQRLGCRQDATERAVAALRSAGVKPLATFDRALSLTCVTCGPAVEPASRALHEAFVTQGVPA